MADALYGHPGDMHQSVIVETDVYESTEVHNIAHCAGELVSGVQIAELQHIAPEKRTVELITVIAQGLADGIFVSMGNPHYVIFTDDVDLVEERGADLERHPATSTSAKRHTSFFFILSP